VLELLTDLPKASGRPFDAVDLPAIGLSAAAFFIVNNVFAGTAAALSRGRPLLGFLREDLGFQIFVAAILLGFSPVVVAVAHYGPYLVPLLILPLVAVYRGGQAARMSEHRALHDELTGLPNRVLFRDRVAQSISQARRGGSTLAVLLMDLDRFKEVNDTLGHHHGDRLLQQVGPRLLAELREGDTVARLGGDEFAIILPASASPADAAIVAERLRAALERPFPIDELAIEVSASIGIACHPDHGDDVETLVQRADIAMYLAKEERTGVRLYAAEHDRHSVDRLELAGQLRHGIEHELVLHFQPKVDLATGGLTGAEALVRWEHPTRGLLAPDAFVPLAENLGLIRPLTHAALTGAIRQVAAWRADGLRLSVAVNVTAQDLVDHTLVTEVDDLLTEYGVPGDALELEITESTLMSDPHRADAVLEGLSARGVRLAIDDFGTGYSSLTYLRRLPIDAVKIDRSFVVDLAGDDSDAAIVTAIVELARRLGLRTVAEGVEDAAAYALLRGMGCDQAQGFLLSRPLRAAEFTAWAAGWTEGRAS
jgi:diguanylate cyclase (GGDEF)-like protein